MRTPTSLPTASSLQLAVTCPASHALPRVDKHLDAGDVGTELHALLAESLEASAPLVRWTQATDSQRRWLDGVLEAVGDRLDRAVAELSYSWHVETGKATLLGSNLGRSYPYESGYIYGTADYVVHSEHNNGTTLVVDLKTGLIDEPPLPRHQQLRFLALCAHGWEGTGAPVQTAILHAPRDGRRPWWEWGPVYDALELVEVAETLRAMVARIGYARKDVAAGKTPRLTVGKHCEYCPARLRCPAQVEMVRRWAGRLDEARRDLEQLLDVETAGLAWARIEAVEAVLKETKRQLYAFASQQPVPLPDGRVLGRHVRRGRDEVNAQRAFDALAAKVGRDEALKAFELSTSKTRLRDVVGEAAPKGEKRKTADAFVAELEAQGIVSQRWREDVGPYDATDKSVTAALPAETTATPPPSSTPVLSAGEEMETAT